MLLDVATKFVIVRPIQSLNTEATIHVLTSIFSEHGLPVGIRCDRGQNFVSDLFQQYCTHLGIQLSYSSAYHHSSNPAERAICTVKGLMKCCVSAKQSWRLALLEYLSTPLDAKTPSPSELSGRKFGSMLPNVSNFSTQQSDRLVERHTAQLQHDTKGRTMCEVPVGSTVRYRNHTKSQFNIGIVSDREGRSYVITTKSGQNVSHNCTDLKKTNVQYTQQHNVSTANSMHAKPSIHPNKDKTDFKSPSKAKLPGKEINVRSKKCVCNMQWSNVKTNCKVNCFYVTVLIVYSMSGTFIMPVA